MKFHIRCRPNNCRYKESIEFDLEHLKNLEENTMKYSLFIVRARNSVYETIFGGENGCYWQNVLVGLRSEEVGEKYFVDYG